MNSLFPDIQLFLDLDGVLIDWNRGTHELHGAEWADNVWPYVRGPKGWNFYKHNWKITTAELFEGQDRSFWANLHWTSDGRNILKVCEHYFGDTICLLTAPFDGDGVVDGRRQWIKQEMPTYCNRMLIGQYKEACAHPKAILIDDCEANIEKWVAMDGLGLLLPKPYNSLYKLWDTPGYNSAHYVLSTLRTLLKEHHE